MSDTHNNADEIETLLNDIQTHVDVLRRKIKAVDYDKRNELKRILDELNRIESDVDELPIIVEKFEDVQRSAKEDNIISKYLFRQYWVLKEHCSRLSHEELLNFDTAINN